MTTLTTIQQNYSILDDGTNRLQRLNIAIDGVSIQFLYQSHHYINSLPSIGVLVACRLEHMTNNQAVVGSTPAWHHYHVQQLWASCSHACASVTKLHNLVQTKGSDTLWLRR